MTSKVSSFLGWLFFLKFPVNLIGMIGSIGIFAGTKYGKPVYISAGHNAGESTSC